MTHRDIQNNISEKDRVFEFRVTAGWGVEEGESPMSADCVYVRLMHQKAIDERLNCTEQTSYEVDEPNDWATILKNCAQAELPDVAEDHEASLLLDDVANAMSAMFVDSHNTRGTFALLLRLPDFKCETSEAC